MQVTGHLTKMRVTLTEPVSYELLLDDTPVPMNPLIGQQITVTSESSIQCIHCGRSTRKSFSQGYCYPCFQTLAECDSCIMSPEKCHYHQGTCRDPEWAHGHCMQPHYVYLANASGLKVGITRGTQVPTRWIDQGAIQAIPMFQTRDRRLAGLIEDGLKAHVSDRTSWQKMLKGHSDTHDMVKERETHQMLIEPKLQELVETFGNDAFTVLDDTHEEADAVSIDFPVNEYPDKVKSHNLDKSPVVSGVLNGIRGQYLLLDSGVLNIRKFTGYKVTLTA